MAFRDIASTSAASTSNSTKLFYEVFINHRGKDTKSTVARSIYDMLHSRGVRAFLDQDELEVGDSFPEALEEAMRSASVHIAIFSPNYVESPWCLEELAFMLRIEVQIIPVFYNVDPSHLRFVRKGIYADAFGQHEKKRKYDDLTKPRYNSQKIKEWEEALQRVSYVTGFTVHGDNCYEGKLKEIVETAINKITKVPLEVATFPVGLDEAVQDFESKVGSSADSKDVHIIGIVGIGGSGKTTLATELYNRKRSFISRSSFLSNVRDADSKNNLLELQKHLLEDLHIQQSTFHSIQQGKVMLARGLESLTVLIVLDDVDHVDQIQALIPQEVMHNLGRGSFIIITTREKKVLKSGGISSVYDMKLLDRFKAKQLFCRHAFLHPQPEFEHPAEKSHKFQDLIEKFVDACNGLPLSLKVIGAMVNGESEAFWKSQLNKLSKILPDEIAKCLKLSYDVLDPEEQQMFLDVACFFIGEEKSMIVAIWDASGWSGEVGWQTLVNKCLIELDSRNRIGMHDHVRDLGRQIARDVAPHRIWKEEHMSIQGERTVIRGILVESIDRRSLERFMVKIMKRSSLPKLQLLSVKGNDFKKRFAALSRDLVWLRWHDFNGPNLPSWLSLANLAVLQLYNATNLEELWPENVEPPLQLRELTIKGKNTCFRCLPRSIGRLKHLKKIVLSGGYPSGMRMRRLPEEFRDLQSLEFLQLSYFPELSSLPHHFGKLINLRTLKLWDVQLTALPNSFKKLKALQTLEISRSKSFRLSSEMLDVLEFMTQLQVLSIEDCPQLEESPHLTNQISLRELQLCGTGLREVPNNMDQLTKLKTLEIGSDNLTSLPESLGALACLTSLTISGCNRLECLPDALGRLSNLQSLEIKFTPLVLEIGFLGIGSPSGCNLNTLKTLQLVKTGVRRISISDDCCPTLQTLGLYFNDNLTEIETLPENVRRIQVGFCNKLKSIRGIGGLLNLKELFVYNCWELEVVECGAYMNSVGHTIRIRDCPEAVVVGVNEESS